MIMKTHPMFGMMALGGALFLSGCQGDERLSEVSTVQTEAQLQAENENLAKKSKIMEEDLSRRHRFYQALKGKYEGSFQSGIGQINFRITFSPSLPPYRTDRVRQLDEISSDLNNLFLNIQVVQWNPTPTPEGDIAAVGCRVSQVKPDLMNGEITIASESCPNLYRLKISETGSTPEDDGLQARSMAQLITEGKIERVETIIGEIQPSTNAAIYSVVATRKE